MALRVSYPLGNNFPVTDTTKLALEVPGGLRERFAESSNTVLVEAFLQPHPKMDSGGSKSRRIVQVELLTPDPRGTFGAQITS